MRFNMIELVSEKEGIFFLKKNYDLTIGNMWI